MSAPDAKRKRPRKPAAGKAAGAPAPDVAPEAAPKAAGSAPAAPAARTRRQVVAIVDYGAQYTQLIARRVRDEGVFSRIHSCRSSAAEIAGSAGEELRGIILSGGPNSVYDAGAPQFDRALLELGVPVLGICYGLQAAVAALGGRVSGGHGREYGRARLAAEGLPGAPKQSIVWMSHGDRVEELPAGFKALAKSDGCPYAAVEGLDGRFLGLQFHPEVTHTEAGATILAEFLHGRCKLARAWRMDDFLQQSVAELRRKVGKERVLLGLSGGVDSSALALLLHRALGPQLHCVFVDNGLLRRGEARQVEDTFRGSFGISLTVVDAGEAFLAALAGVEEPEEKRRRIGKTFIDVFTKAARSLEKPRYLAQGTLYPDVIESVAAHGGPTQTIKTHHNVGGLPKELGFELIEPFRDLFKDEVRQIGSLLGLPEAIVKRHPFPGPGLAVRCPGAVSKERLDILRGADAIFREELERSGWMGRTAQAFVVLLPVRSVGVMGDGRTYENVAALRCVDTSDFMTADWTPLPHEFLAKVSNRICNEVRGINRVVYDISSKPPATIEWE